MSTAVNPTLGTLQYEPYAVNPTPETPTLAEQVWLVRHRSDSFALRLHVADHSIGFHSF